MAKINFPLSPSLNDLYTFNAITWEWDGEKWIKSSATETGNTEGTTGGIAYYDGKSSTIKGALNAFYDETNERVGIGTSGPTELLDVRGGITADGGIHVTGGATFGGGLHVIGDNVSITKQYATIGQDSAKIQFNGAGNQIVLDTATAVDIKQRLRHYGDTDTYLQFDTNNIFLESGGNKFLDSSATATNIGGVTFSSGGSMHGGATFGNDITIMGDSAIRQAQGKPVITFSPTTQNLNIGDSTSEGNSSYINIRDSHSAIVLNADTTIALNCAAVTVEDDIQHSGDTDTKITFATDNIKAQAGGNVFIEGTPHGISAGGATFDSVNIYGDGLYVANGITADRLQVVSGATFGGSVIVDDQLTIRGNLILTDDAFIGVASNDERIIFDSSANDITLKTNNVFIDRKLLHNGDGDTFLEFTTNEINLRAGGTDYINITSAGVNFEDNTVSRGKFKDYSETFHDVGDINASTAFDFENGNVQKCKVTGTDTGSQIVFSLSNPPASGTAGTMTVLFEQGLAHGDVAFHSSIEFPGGNAPTLTATSDKMDIISFLTVDAGTTYYAFVGGLNFTIN